MFDLVRPNSPRFLDVIPRAHFTTSRHDREPSPTLPLSSLFSQAGDTMRDIEEGVHAGCGHNIGVLSGADNEATLRASGADHIMGKITDLTVS
jgi:hypothetical protein